MKRRIERSERHAERMRLHRQAQKALKRMEREEKKKARLDSILSKIEEIKARVGCHFGISAEELSAHTRIPEVVRPRQVAMYVVRKQTAASLPEIGAAFGGIDYTTVIYSVRNVERRMEREKGFREVVGGLAA